MSGFVQLSARDRERLKRRKRAKTPTGWSSGHFSAPLSPEAVRPPPSPKLELEPIVRTVKMQKADLMTETLRSGILKSHAPDGTELLFYTHQTRALELTERKEKTAFILEYATGAGKTIIAAAVIACCFKKLQQFGKEHEMKIAIVVPKTLRAQWKAVLLRWLRISPSDVLEVAAGEDMTHAAIEKAKIVLVTRTLLAGQLNAGFVETERGSGKWVQNDGAPLPAIFDFRFHRLIVDEIHTNKRSAERRVGKGVWARWSPVY